MKITPAFIIWVIKIFSGDTWKVRYTNQIRTRYRNWRTSSATQLQPSKSLCYIGYTSTRLDSCVLVQEATTFNNFYDGVSFQHLATVLISVFALCYGPGLLFRGPFCITTPTYIGYLRMAPRAEPCSRFVLWMVYHRVHVLDDILTVMTIQIS